LRKEELLKMVMESLKEESPEVRIRDIVKRENNAIDILGNKFTFKRLHIFGIGKASISMVKPFVEEFQDVLKSCVVVTKRGYGEEVENVEVYEGGHPIPDEGTIEGSKKIVEKLREADEDDLVIFLVSGGGSSTYEIPMDGIDFEDLKKLYDLILKSGMNIREMNVVRKHVSKVKGGKTAFLTKAKIVTLMVSDVVGDDPSTIASGPTYPDFSTYKDAVWILKRWKLWEKIPESVRRVLSEGEKGLIPETPKYIDEERVKNIVISGSRSLCTNLKRKFESMGYRSLLLSTFLEGEARELGKFLAGVAKEIVNSGNPISPPCVLISGGEALVKVKGKGKGGPNMEVALSFAMEMEGENFIFLSMDTDGTDGPTDAAGALIDGETLRRIKEKGMDPIELLDNNDSYTALSISGDLLVTGPTGTNVNDLRVLVLEG